MDRIDLPMRAFAGGFYANLKAMYDFLEVPYQPQRFLFGFSKIPGSSKGQEHLHFLHSSNNHNYFPIKPQAATVFAHFVEIAYLIVWYVWFTICCFFVEPIPATATSLCESFGAYVQRIQLPAYFTSSYLLPLFSSVATCPHEELLDFPAYDLIQYKRKTNWDQHYTVSGGVHAVQRKLAGGLRIHKSARVVAVEPQTLGTKVCWESTLDGPGSKTSEAIFDRVVLAIPPNAVQNIFKPLEREMAQIPILSVQSVVHTDETAIERISGEDSFVSLRTKTSIKSSDAQVIYLRTSTDGSPKTESIHIQPSGVIVTTCPVTKIDPAKTTQCSTFTRVLRTSQSRQIIIDIFNRSSTTPKVYKEKETPRWKNGDGGVWIAGGWCWDGMVLLEGCIVSSMAIADAFGVEIPWKYHR